MVIKNLKLVLANLIIENGYLAFENGKIAEIASGNYDGEAIDGEGLIAMPGFIDIHVHGAVGIDFMDAGKEDYRTIANSLFQEGVTTFLATTLTSDYDSLRKVCETVKSAIDEVPSLGGIHLEGPYINEKCKGAQNPIYARNPDAAEFLKLQAISGNNIRYLTLAPEKVGAMNFIKEVASSGVTVSVGHSDASFQQVEEAIQCGLTNVTHTHNAMSGHNHRSPGVVTAAFYFDQLFTEFICDEIHVCPEVLKTSYKIIGPNRFIIVTDALKAKHSSLESFQLYGLNCIRKNGAAYLTSGPLAGSLSTLDQGVRNMHSITDASLIELSKISSTNAAQSLHLKDRGEIAVGKLADIVLLNNDLEVKEVYKLGKKVL
jgi:N-acetylglucosamine-6-phosphate deacetylase